MWIPSHKKALGNEEVNRLAKKYQLMISLNCVMKTLNYFQKLNSHKKAK